MLEFIESTNIKLYQLICASTATPNWQIVFATWCADFLVLIVPIGLTFIWVRGTTDDRRNALLACIVTFVNLFLNQIIGAIMYHPRPFAIGLSKFNLNHLADSSFPSDHGTVFACIAVTLIMSKRNRYVGFTIAFIGSIVAWSRIFLGLHFPIDILGSIALAIMIYAITRRIWSKFDSKLLSLAENAYRALFQPLIKGGWFRE